MKITRDMPIGPLAELLRPNGMETNADAEQALREAMVMREQLAANAAAYGWQTTNDVEDTDWHRMADAARASTQIGRSMSVTIYTNGVIAIDGRLAGLSVSQTSAGTRVINTIDGSTVPMPCGRYSLAGDTPASGVAGRAQFDADILALLNAA